MNFSRLKREDFALLSNRGRYDDEPRRKQKPRRYLLRIVRLRGRMKPPYLPLHVRVIQSRETLRILFTCLWLWVIYRSSCINLFPWHQNNPGKVWSVDNYRKDRFSLLPSSRLSLSLAELPFWAASFYCVGNCWPTWHDREFLIIEKTFVASVGEIARQIDSCNPFRQKYSPLDFSKHQCLFWHPTA